MTTRLQKLVEAFRIVDIDPQNKTVDSIKDELKKSSRTILRLYHPDKCKKGVPELIKKKYEIKSTIPSVQCEEYARIINTSVDTINTELALDDSKIPDLIKNGLNINSDTQKPEQPVSSSVNSETQKPTTEQPVSSSVNSDTQKPKIEQPVFRPVNSDTQKPKTEQPVFRPVNSNTPYVGGSSRPTMTNIFDNPRHNIDFNKYLSPTPRMIYRRKPDVRLSVRHKPKYKHTIRRKYTSPRKSKHKSRRKSKHTSPRKSKKKLPKTRKRTAYRMKKKVVQNLD